MRPVLPALNFEPGQCRLDRGFLVWAERQAKPSAVVLNSLASLRDAPLLESKTGRNFIEKASRRWQTYAGITSADERGPIRHMHLLFRKVIGLDIRVGHCSCCNR